MEPWTSRIEVTAEAAAGLLAGYAIEPATSAERLTEGIANTNFKVLASGRAYLLRIYGADRTPDAVELELSILRRLTELGFPAQRPVPLADGRWQQSYEGLPCVLLEMLPGRTPRPEELTAALAQQVGQLLGRLHRALAGFTPSGSKAPVELPELEHRMQRSAQLLERIGRSDLARWLRESWRAATSDLTLADLPTGVVHADVFRENIVVDEHGQIVGFIDFDDTYVGVLLHDLAIAALELTPDPAGAPQPALARSVIDGYQAIAGPVDQERLVRLMWLNCYRFLRHSLPQTLAAGEPAETDPYLQRLRWYGDDAHRNELLDAIRSH